MIKIAIAEDEKKCSDQIRRYLEEYAVEKNLELQVQVYPNGELLVNTYRAEYDVIFMDIEMPKLNGMDAARKIRCIDDNVIIIFVSMLAQYVINGYEVRAMDFVLKPVSKAVLSQKMDRAMDSLKYRRNQAVVVKNGKGDITKIDIHKIYYIEVYNHKLFIHTEQGVYTATGTLNMLEKCLNMDSFARCNSGYLVNLQHVKQIEQEEVLVGNERLKIGRTRKKIFLQALTDYVGGTIL